MSLHRMIDLTRAISDLLLKNPFLPVPDPSSLEWFESPVEYVLISCSALVGL